MLCPEAITFERKHIYQGNSQLKKERDFFCNIQQSANFPAKNKQRQENGRYLKRYKHNSTFYIHVNISLIETNLNGFSLR